MWICSHISFNVSPCFRDIFKIYLSEFLKVHALLNDNPSYDRGCSINILELL
jgi:hypothetical protein